MQQYFCIHRQGKSLEAKVNEVSAGVVKFMMVEKNISEVRALKKA